MTVAAYSRKREFDRAFSKLQTDLDGLKAEDRAEDVEYICGVKYRKGHLADMRQIRERDRLRRQQYRPESDNDPMAPA